MLTFKKIVFSTAISLYLLSNIIACGNSFLNCRTTTGTVTEVSDGCSIIETLDGKQYQLHGEHAQYSKLSILIDNNGTVFNLTDDTAILDQ